LNHSLNERLFKKTALFHFFMTKTISIFPSHSFFTALNQEKYRKFFPVYLLKFDNFNQFSTLPPFISGEFCYI